MRDADGAATLPIAVEPDGDVVGSTSKSVRP
jgi:hypothetical protein